LGFSPFLKEKSFNSIVSVALSLWLVFFISSHDTLLAVAFSLVARTFLLIFKLSDHSGAFI